MTASAPRLRHLNSDSSWLVHIPLAGSSGADCFTLLLDPWFTGPQTDYSRLLSTQWHSEPSSVQHVAEIKERIDAVLVSHEYTDHMHRATLLQVAPEVPVYAPKKAAAIIRSWRHFTNVHDVPLLAPAQSWHAARLPGLPAYIAIARLCSTSWDLIPHFHSAICIAYSIEGEEASAIVYTPHGTPAAAMTQLRGNGISEVRALLHGLHEYWNPWILGGKLNLGAINGLRSMRACNAKYWIGTHDERKKASGIVHRVLGTRAWTLEDVLKEEGGDARFVALGNGEELALD